MEDDDDEDRVDDELEQKASQLTVAVVVVATTSFSPNTVQTASKKRITPANSAMDVADGADHRVARRRTSREKTGPVEIDTEKLAERVTHEPSAEAEAELGDGEGAALIDETEATRIEIEQ